MKRLFSLLIFAVFGCVSAEQKDAVRRVTWLLDSSSTIVLEDSVHFASGASEITLPAGTYLPVAQDAGGTYWMFDKLSFQFCTAREDLKVGGLFIPGDATKPKGVWAASELRSKNSTVVFLSVIPESVGIRLSKDQTKMPNQ